MRTITPGVPALLLAICVTLTASQWCSAQPNVRDSLIQLLQKENRDTARVMLLRDLALAYSQMSKADSQLYNINKGLELARAIKFKKGEAAHLNALGSLMSTKGNQVQALKLYLEALQINEQLNEYDGMGRNLNNIGATYATDMNDFRSAIPYYLRALDAYEKASSRKYNSTVLINLWRCYVHLGIFDSARVYAQKVYDRGLANNKPIDISAGLAMLGNCYLQTGEYQLALEHGRRSVAILDNAKLTSPEILSALGEIYEKLGRPDSALHYVRRAYFSLPLNPYSNLTEKWARTLARLYKEVDRNDSSLHYYEIAVAVKDSINQRGQTVELGNMLFNEKMREAEKASAAVKAAAERKHNLQYSAIAFGLIAFIILFFVLSHSIVANQKLIRFLGIIALLIVFEFLNLLLHPWLGAVTHHSPILMLLAMVCVAALLIPLHHKLEHWITHRLVEKNKKIRLHAAKRTIATLENEII